MSLNPKISTYSLDNALACANASQLAYDPAIPITTAKVSAAFGLNVSDLVPFKGGRHRRRRLRRHDGRRHSDRVSRHRFARQLARRRRGAAGAVSRQGLGPFGFQVFARQRVERDRRRPRQIERGRAHAVESPATALAARSRCWPPPTFRFPLDAAATIPKPIAGLTHSASRASAIPCSASPATPISATAIFRFGQQRRHRPARAAAPARLLARRQCRIYRRQRRHPGRRRLVARLSRRRRGGH